MTKTATLVTSQYNNPQPQIEMKFPKGTSHRIINAEIYKLAAEIESASISEQWVVVPDPHVCKVYLELMYATEREANAAMVMLDKIANQ